MAGRLRIIVSGALLARVVGHLQVSASHVTDVADNRVLLAEIDSVQEQANQVLSGTSADKSIQQHQVTGQAKLGNSSSASSRGFALLSTSTQRSHLRAARELQAVERRAGLLMRKHPKELHRVQTLLQAAWRMARHSSAAVSLHQRLRVRFASLLQVQHSPNQEPLGPLLHDYAAGMDRVAELDRHILEATTQAKQDMGSVLKDEGPRVVATVEQMLDAAKQKETQAISAELREARDAREETRHFQQATSRMTSGGLPGNTIRKGTRSSKSSKEALRQTQKEIQRWQRKAAQLHHKILAWRIPDTPEEPQSVREPHQVEDVKAQHLRLANRERRLITQGESLDASLSRIRMQVADTLQADGDAVDADLSGELLNQLAQAQKILQDMTFFHKQFAIEADRKINILSGKGFHLSTSGSEHVPNH